jgi:hypothetical protein
MIIAMSLVLAITGLILPSEIRQSRLSGRTPDLTTLYMSWAFIVATIIVTLLAIIVVLYLSIKARVSNHPVKETAEKVQQYLATNESQEIPIYKLQKKYWLARDELFPELEAMIAKNRIPYAIDDVNDALERVRPPTPAPEK